MSKRKRPSPSVTVVESAKTPRRKLPTSLRAKTLIFVSAFVIVITGFSGWFWHDRFSGKVITGGGDYQYQPSAELLGSTDYQEVMARAQLAIEAFDGPQLDAIEKEASERFKPPEGLQNVDLLYLQYQKDALNYSATSMQPGVDVVTTLQQIIDGAKVSPLRSYFEIDESMVKTMQENSNRPGGIPGGES